MKKGLRRPVQDRPQQHSGSAQRPDEEGIKTPASSKRCLPREVRHRDLMKKGLRPNLSANIRSHSSVRHRDLMKKGLRRHSQTLASRVLGSAQRPDEEGIKTTFTRQRPTSTPFGTET